MKITLLLFLLSFSLFAQHKIDVGSVVTSPIDINNAVSSEIHFIDPEENSIKLCRYRDMGPPCTYFTRTMNLKTLKWPDGSDVKFFLSVQVMTNLYRVVIEGRNPANGQNIEVSVKKEDGIVNLSNSIIYSWGRVTRAPLKVCAGYDHKGPCDYVWRHTFGLNGDALYSQFDKNVRSFSLAEGYEASFCTENGISGTCQNFTGYRKVKHFNLNVSSWYLRKYDEDAIVNLCYQRNALGVCTDASIGSHNINGELQIVNGSYQSFRIKENYEATVCPEAFYMGVCREVRGPAVWNAPVGFLINAIDIRTQSNFWNSYQYLSTYPKDVEESWTENNQGVAHDDENWYFTTTTLLMKYHISSSLRGSPDRWVSLPNDCGHFGDLSYYKGKLYIAMEQCEKTNGDSGSERRIYIYSARNLQVLRYGILKNESNASWVAINPQNGLMYSSGFFDECYGNIVKVYDPNFTNRMAIRELYQVRLNVAISRIQGGAFSDNGNLYLVSDDREDSDRAGIYAYRVKGRRGQYLKWISPKGLALTEEMEGITIWDTNGKNIYGISGQIHWVLVRNEYFTNDDGYFKHIAVDDPTGL